MSNQLLITPSNAFVRNTSFVVNGLTVKVNAFSANDAFSHPGGTITLPANGTWYIGADLFSGEIIALPRLGHRGWVPVAKVVTGAAAVTSIDTITPVVPASRLPQLHEKLRAGQTVNVLVLGSSLAEGAGTTTWSGMLFNSSSSPNYYKLPGTITFNNYALGGTSNQYQLAQTGIGSSYNCMDYSEAGYPNAIAGKTPPNGRSTMFSGVDLVVLTTLANGGDYRLQCIEPIVRNLRKMGVEVLLTTDNPQAAQPFSSYASAIASALYVDGPYVKRIADKYKCEFADTAAYVVGACFRYPSVNIYAQGDSIHMASGAPAGRTGQPGGGHEVWARSIRSTISLSSVAVGTVVSTYDFNDGTTQGFTRYNATGTVTVSGSALVATNGDASAQYGALIVLPATNAGDTIRIQGTASKSVEVGTQYSGWDSTHGGVVGTFDYTLTISNTRSSTLLLFFGGVTPNETFTLDNLTITVNSTYVGGVTDLLPGRGIESQVLPASRVVSDFKTPGDAFVILPADEFHYRMSSGAGTLGASPLGASSFARRFSSNTGASTDLLTLTSGQKAAVSALGVVGFSLIYYSVAGDPEVVFDVYKNNTFQKTITISAQTMSREIYLPVYTPTQENKADAIPNNSTIDIRITAGTLRVAALVALTFEMDLLPPEAALKVGTWTAKVQGGYPSMMGYGTDTINDYAVAQCPPNARRLSWIISSKPNSKLVDTWSGRTIAANSATSGTNHVKTKGNHIGPGEAHYIKLKEAQSNTDQSTNGYGLHIGGIILTYDR